MGAFLLGNRDSGLLRIDASLGFREGDAAKTRPAESEGPAREVQNQRLGQSTFVDALH